MYVNKYIYRVSVYGAEAWGSRLFEEIRVWLNSGKVVYFGTKLNAKRASAFCNFSRSSPQKFIHKLSMHVISKVFFAQKSFLIFPLNYKS